MIIVVLLLIQKYPNKESLGASTRFSLQATLSLWVVPLVIMEQFALKGVQYGKSYLFQSLLVENRVILNA